MFPLYRQASKGVEKLGNVPKAPELVGDGVGFQISSDSMLAACPGLVFSFLGLQEPYQSLHFEGHLK